MHIEHADFIVMTIASLVPLLLYQAYVFGRRIQHIPLAAEGAYVAYIVSSVRRAPACTALREYFADHYASDVTGEPDALSSALVTIACGLVQQDGEYRQAIDERTSRRGDTTRRDHRLAGALAVMGISEREVWLGVSCWEMAIPYCRARVMRWDPRQPVGTRATE